jgi:hypothetical protein
VHTIWPDDIDSVGIVSFSLPGADAGLLATCLSAELRAVGRRLAAGSGQPAHTGGAAGLTMHA